MSSDTTPPGSPMGLTDVLADQGGHLRDDLGNMQLDWTESWPWTLRLAALTFANGYDAVANNVIVPTLRGESLPERTARTLAMLMNDFPGSRRGYPGREFWRQPGFRADGFDDGPSLRIFQLDMSRYEAGMELQGPKDNPAGLAVVSAVAFSMIFRSWRPGGVLPWIVLPGLWGAGPRGLQSYVMGPATTNHEGHRALRQLLLKDEVPKGAQLWFPAARFLQRLIP